jgi:methionine synthase I (cobalamin-dependent)
MDRLRRILASGSAGGVVLLDGGIGTELLRLGAPSGQPLEGCNLSHPQLVRQVHAGYRAAGAIAHKTNTFLARPTAQPGAPSGHDREWWQRCNCQGVRLARDSVGAEGLVFASLGPPRPEVPRAEAIADALAQATALAQSGPQGQLADALLIETQSSPAFVAGLLEALDRWPEWQDRGVIVSFAYRGDQGPPRLHPGGEGPEEAAAAVQRFRPLVVALGANCGREMGLEALEEVVRRYRACTDLPLFLSPNAGTPAATPEGLRWPVSPEEFARWAETLARGGVRLLGGCCGTTPAHLAAAADRLRTAGLLAASAQP